jgi:hypothetical protein
VEVAGVGTATVGWGVEPVVKQGGEAMLVAVNAVVAVAAVQKETLALNYQ